jgi:hypothetical protein
MEGNDKHPPLAPRAGDTIVGPTGSPLTVTHVTGDGKLVTHRDAADRPEPGCSPQKGVSPVSRLAGYVKEED